MTNVRQAAKTYLSQSVAAYLRTSSSYCQSALFKLFLVASESSPSLETDPSLASHPPFLAELSVTDDSALRTLSTGAQAGSLLPLHVDSSASFASTSVSDADSGNLSTSGVESPHPVPPLSLAYNDTIVSDVPNLPATLAESLSSSLTLSTPSAQSETSINDRKSAFAPAPVLPPLALPATSAVRASGFALPNASSPSSPRPGSADSNSRLQFQPHARPSRRRGASPPVQSEASLGSANGGPDAGAHQGMVEGENAPLPLDVLTALDWAAASENTEPPVPPKTDLAERALPPAPSTAHDDWGADEDSGSELGLELWLGRRSIIPAIQSSAKFGPRRRGQVAPASEHGLTAFTVFIHHQAFSIFWNVLGSFWAFSESTNGSNYPAG
ncbi:hypothetical protein K438DRAFT_1947242 [Mycena galopus ATCC 62051]|nr:hypothetical protein K438DRAFT_1947242 [Mycena galopus ATCC 62051]